MTSREIKDIKIMADGGGMITPKKLILQSGLIFPLPKIQGVTIKGKYDGYSRTEGWRKGILMSQDGIVRTLDEEWFDGEYTPFANVMSKNDVLIIEYWYGGGNTMNWKWPDGTLNRRDIWPDYYYNGSFKIEGADEWYGLATYPFDTGVGIRNSVDIIENLSADQGKYHVVGLYEIEEN